MGRLRSGDLTHYVCKANLASYRDHAPCLSCKLVYFLLCVLILVNLAIKLEM